VFVISKLTFGYSSFSYCSRWSRVLQRRSPPCVHVKCAGCVCTCIGDARRAARGMTKAVGESRDGRPLLLVLLYIVSVFAKYLTFGNILRCTKYLYSVLRTDIHVSFVDHRTPMRGGRTLASFFPGLSAQSYSYSERGAVESPCAGSLFA
jgi:hypothetical protein